MSDTKYYGVFDAEGLPTAFYTSDIWAEGDIPPEAVEITQLQWTALLTKPGEVYYSNGEVRSKLGAEATPAAPKAKTEPKAEVKAKAKPKKGKR